MQSTTLILDDYERRTLQEAVRRHIEELTKEVVATSSHPLQHALAQTIERLEIVASRLEGAQSSGR